MALDFLRKPWKETKKLFDKSHTKIVIGSEMNPGLD